mmetsp:Transcript_57885/g.129075  ORF Transcript_57885/g.129075 Transcript_57885/m.129075 type:complete len:241 (+) Transcript_57885:419-1141(+)
MAAPHSDRRAATARPHFRIRRWRMTPSASASPGLKQNSRSRPSSRCRHSSSMRMLSRFSARSRPGWRPSKSCSWRWSTRVSWHRPAVRTTSTAAAATRARREGRVNWRRCRRLGRPVGRRRERPSTGRPAGPEVLARARRQQRERRRRAGLAPSTRPQRCPVGRSRVGSKPTHQILCFEGRLFEPCHTAVATAAHTLLLTPHLHLESSSGCSLLLTVRALPHPCVAGRPETHCKRAGRRT